MKLATLLFASIPASLCSALSSIATPKITTPSSCALNSILANEEQTLDQFFQNTWQKKPHVYRQLQSTKQDNPFHNQIQMGLPGITHALENACEAFLAPPSPEWQFTLPIVSKDKQCLSLEQLAPLYGNNLFDAYLDGCSVLLNHNDRHCPYTAALCQDLQKSFPYVYANAYLTPPASQAVAAHADDRDVFVIQVYGRKAWKVYKEVPVEYPYTHEQVGKNELSVPQSVLDGDLLVDTVLNPSDVLYIPRGYVHEACTHQQENEDGIQPSYHITIALATFDWSMSDLLATAVKKTLDNVPEYRMATPVEFGMRNTEDIPIQQREMLEKQVERALDLVKKELTAEAINNYLTQKYQWHAKKSEPWRLHRMHQSLNSVNNIPQGDVGSNAIKGLSMNTFVRASSTKQESDSLTNTRLKQVRIRTETQTALYRILDHVQKNPADIFQISNMLELLDDKCDYICDLTLLSFVRSCVERGSMSVVG